MTDPWREGPREECGVFGVIWPGQVVAPLVYLGLLALQHRGQESAGIATWSEAGLHLHKGMGLVSRVFDDRLSALLGSVGIGHVRYSTMGSAVLENAQPVAVPSPWGTMAVAHNGNLTNAPQLREELQRRGVRFRGTSDTEVLAWCVATSSRRTPESAIRAAMERLEGAYTVVALIDGALFAFRDPFAIRPLVLGRLGEGWVVASETCAFDQIGAAFVRDVLPGELVVVRGGQLHGEVVLPSPRRAHCVFEYIYFARPDTNLVGRNVHTVRRAMGRVLAREHPADADLVVPVPDSGTSAALGFAEQSGLRFELALVKNRYVGRTFIEPDPQRRDLGVRVKLNPVRELVAGQRVVLVDDSIVRGTTSGKIVQVLREAGAREVHVRISSPPIRWPCFYGVDTSSRRQLVAAELDVEQIRQRIGADSLGYLSQEGLVEAIGLSRAELCMACLDGRYPTGQPQEELAGRMALEVAR
ncbi:MAG: amidophosphoribosyltransferase [Armatimonadota bacterium]|nr:amidophosphoribosyltransferase [Armatimonadota bacterium]MDR5676255.1 amidophosphoribosyltransferase [Armatimonadota bacterium]MDR5688368.1 amidophosphoribosyltransferase [Armatimonadota bacterium]MDR7388518.1 amidophosphoribosyltransferase [Armatimonadota bacterium]MDR7391331.1 amidophosphoribosyltransferase [Armatimonadota bacterium]